MGQEEERMKAPLIQRIFIEYLLSDRYWNTGLGDGEAHVIFIPYNA